MWPSDITLLCLCLYYDLQPFGNFFLFVCSSPMAVVSGLRKAGPYVYHRTRAGSYREATEPYGGGSSDWWQVPKEKKTLWGERSLQQDLGQPIPTWNIIVSLITNNHQVLIIPQALKWQCHLMGSLPPPQDIGNLITPISLGKTSERSGARSSPQLVRRRTKI